MIQLWMILIGVLIIFFSLRIFLRRRYSKTYILPEIVETTETIPDKKNKTIRTVKKFKVCDRSFDTKYDARKGSKYFAINGGCPKK